MIFFQVLNFQKSIKIYDSFNKDKQLKMFDCIYQKITLLMENINQVIFI